ncbi:bifunctional glycosyltransferase/CDP-glycerol:glycerophosphate glycerophosphotransferase [Streptomyces sp. KR80]|uniref:bifunctional glycosyltransferase/CDP-glycerol:glycerophosphate glycerophosphotransferase n=1 Tax=Streptomyces sp. KR80 TaxID=3457426 RepID=UPI003FD28FB7
MITVSVIVTARNHQGYLRECLDSALALPSGNRADGKAFELIGVDNGSTDGTRAILDEFAARDSRVRALHFPRPLTAGAARDAGAALAQGSYLLFLGGTDALVPDALPSLVTRLDAAEEPDVLVFDHASWHWRTLAIESGDSRLLGRPGPAAFPLADHPNLLHATPTLGNRLLRRDLYRAHRELFTKDEFAEVLPALGSLLTAERIAATDAVYVRRYEPDAPQLPDTPDAYGNLFAQYDALMALIAARPETAPLHNVFFTGMVRHYLRLLAAPGLPESARAGVFHRASEHFTRFRPTGYRRPAGLDGIRHALLERDGFTGYRALQIANHKRRNVRELAARAKQRAEETALAGYYREQLLRPIAEDLAVFSSYWDRGVACSPAAISAKLGELAPDIRQVWVVRSADAPLVPPGTTCVVPGTRRYWSVLARAKFLVNNVNFADEMIKRPGQILVQTHHGTPVKRMGTDQIPFPATSRGVDYEALVERCRNWDYSISANSHSTEIWERAYPVPFTSLNYGYPRNDVYYTATAVDVRRVRERLGIAQGRVALLYAPTHRDYEATWTPRLDLETLARRLGEDFVLLVRGHYFYDSGPSPLEELHRRGIVIDVSGSDSVEELALASDALITDYSSLMFDYANLDRPIVIFADDWEIYSNTRGVYFDVTRCAPGPVARSQEDVVEIFLSDAWRSPEAGEQRAEFRRRFCQFDDGHAAERVVRHVFLGQPGTPPIIPIERRTPAPPPGVATPTPPRSTTALVP